MKKKIADIILLFILAISFSTAIEAKEKVIFTSDSDFIFGGYVVKNNEIYILFEEYQEKAIIYKYDNEKLKLINIPEKEIKKILKEVEPFYNTNEALQKIKINEAMFLIFEEVSYECYKFYICENDNKKDVLGTKYICTAAPMGEYVYVDKKNKKIYFSGSDNNKKETGLYVYDINKNIVDEIHTNKINDNYESIIYSSPIRIPNTPYLLYQQEKGSSYQPKRTVYIEEIPEWKAELENKSKPK
jgi:hypothetical protein